MIANWRIVIENLQVYHSNKECSKVKIKNIIEITLLVIQSSVNHYHVTGWQHCLFIYDFGMIITFKLGEKNIPVY